MNDGADHEELERYRNDRTHGYECPKCGYVPTQRELDRGKCPECIA